MGWTKRMEERKPPAVWAEGNCLSEPQALLTAQQRKGLSSEEKKKHLTITDPSAQPSLYP